MESTRTGVRISVNYYGSWVLTRDGQRVRGGSGDTPAVFSDPMCPIGKWCTYKLETDYASEEAYTRRDAFEHVISSLDGLTVAYFKWLGDGEMTLEPRAHATTVPGRARPVLRLQPTAGDGVMSLTARTSPLGTSTLRTLFKSNEPLLIFHNLARCEVPNCDIPPVEVFFPEGSSIKSRRTGHLDTAVRDWDLELRLVDIGDWDSRIGVGTWTELENLSYTWGFVEDLKQPWTQFEEGKWNG